MRKIVVCSIVAGWCLAFVAIGSVGHAEEFTGSRPLLVAQAKPDRTVIIDGVEYVPKGSGNSRHAHAGSEASQHRSDPDPDGAINEGLENFAMKGKYGAGIEISAVNLGIGPSAEYWFTDNIVASGHIGLGSFTTFGIRGDYVFSKPLKLYHTYTAEPYLGLGYTYIKGPEESFPGGSVKTDGSGVDLHAGLFMPAQFIYKNVALRAEVAYSTATVEATGTAASPVPGGAPITAKVSADYSSFGLGLGIYYYFR